MISKNQLKLLTSLHQKKYRIKYNLFIVEGVKTVNEFLKSNIECETLLCTKDYQKNLITDNPTIITENELKKISSLKSPNKVIGIFKIPKPKPIKQEGLIMVLDTINDPGNLGTIIRLCDWFGVTQLVCSESTVDCYNAKVVQSTMGSLTRVSVSYTNLTSFLKETKLPIYGAVMEGENVYKSDLLPESILIMGNESNGISPEIQNLLNHKITIPRFGEIQKTESLNVATASAILLNEFRRN